MKKKFSRFLKILICLGILYISPSTQAQDSSPQENLIPPSLKERIEKGLNSLAKSQSPEGSFSQNFKLASTALCGLAFLSHPGSGYKRGPYGENIARCLDYILSLVRESDGKIKYTPGVGVWIHDGQVQGRMHAHCYATLFLAEVYGTLRSPYQENLVKAALKGAVELLVRSQTYGVGKLSEKQVEYGGWGYYHKFEPKWGEDEASITICVIQAFRAARNAGITVSASVIDRAINYVKLCMKEDGSVRYSLARGISRVSYEITAAAVSTLNAAGVYRSAELDRGLMYMRRMIEDERKAGNSPDKAAQNWNYYGNLYAAQAMYQSGDVFWKPWFQEVSASLIKDQNAEGYWESNKFENPYATAMNLLVLQIPFQSLPIFQR